MHSKIQFWLYLHEEGDEFFLHYDYWPNVPPMYHVKHPETWLDIVIKKELHVANDNCLDGSYFYVGRLFKVYCSIMIQVVRNRY